MRCLAPICGVKSVILYGSFARGDFGPKSDLDLFIITDKVGARNAVLKALAELDLDRRLIMPPARTFGGWWSLASGFFKWKSTQTEWLPWLDDVSTSCVGACVVRVWTGYSP